MNSFEGQHSSNILAQIDGEGPHARGKQEQTGQGLFPDPMLGELVRTDDVRGDEVKW